VAARKFTSISRGIAGKKEGTSYKLLREGVKTHKKGT